MSVQAKGAIFGVVAQKSNAIDEVSSLEDMHLVTIQYLSDLHRRGRHCPCHDTVRRWCLCWLLISASDRANACQMGTTARVVEVASATNNEATEGDTDGDEGKDKALQCVLLLSSS